MEKRAQNATIYIEQILKAISMEVGLNSHSPPIFKTIQIRGPRHVGHCWRRKDEFITDVLPLTLLVPVCADQQRTFLQHLCKDTGCSLEDLPVVIEYEDERWEKVREISVSSIALWWWWSCTYTNHEYFYNQYDFSTLLWIISEQCYHDDLYINKLHCKVNV